MSYVANIKKKIKRAIPSNLNLMFVNNNMFADI